MQGCFSGELMVKDVIQIKYADSFLSESAIFEGGIKGKMCPIVFSFYAIKTENKIILVDAGCDSMGGFVMNNFLLPDESLRNKGIAPENITDIIITHADHDHIDGVHHFKNAVVHIQEDEYLRGQKYIPSDMTVKTFDDATILYDCIKVVKIGGHQKGSCVVEFSFNGEDCVIVGDECYSRYNILNKLPTASSYNKENSERFIKKYANGKQRIYLLH